MSETAIRAAPPMLWGIGLRQVRIACGLILFSYLLSHFSNHALGNVSYAVMSDWLDVHMAFWQHPVVAAVFYSAGVTHWGLGLWALYERRQFRYRLPEWTQLLLGLSIPFLLASHFIGARLQATLFDRDVYYAQVFNANWISRPYMEWVQFTLLLVAWVHGCIGLYFWLRLKRFFARAAPWLLVAATLLPTLALLGLIQGGREVVALAKLPEWRAANLSPRPPANAAAARRCSTRSSSGSPITYAAVAGTRSSPRAARGRSPSGAAARSPCRIRTA